MDDQQRYDDLVQSFATLGYELMRSKYGYVVISRADPGDVSYARLLNDLADLTELIRWRVQYTIRRQQDT